MISQHVFVFPDGQFETLRVTFLLLMLVGKMSVKQDSSGKVTKNVIRVSTKKENCEGSISIILTL